MKKKLLISLLCVVVTLAVTLPAIAAPADIGGFYISQISPTVYDNNGVKYTLPYKYLGFNITQEDEVLAGVLYGLNTSTVAGCKAQAGTTTYNASVVGYTGWTHTKNLAYGVNTLNITGTGLIGAYLKHGCDGTATSGTGTLKSSPVTLADGWNTLNITATGTITIALYLDYTTIGLFAGTMGSSRFFIAGPTLPTWLDAGTANITGVTDVCPDNSTRIFAPGGIFSVVGDGNITLDMPIGSTGNITGDSLTVDGEASLNLTAGENEITIAGQPGTFTVNLQLWKEYQWNGKATTSWWSGKTSLRGTFVGYLVLDQDPWNGEMLGFTLSATEVTSLVPD